MVKHFSHVEVPVDNAHNESPIIIPQAYESSDSSEESMSKPLKRKASARSAKKDPYSAEVLLTSSKSKLIDVPDLHGKLARFFGDPEKWKTLPEAEKAFIRSIAPPNVVPNDDGSLPEKFWKYDNDFRRECRMLQEDLAAGRLEPEWQQEAHKAMNERAAGMFDDFKEREFEEHWGQKQKPQWDYLAGHASKVLLSELLSAGLFQVGDVWSFFHIFGRGTNTIAVSKECTIVKIDGKTVTLAIPPGQLKYARRLDLSQPHTEKETDIGFKSMNEPLDQKALENENDNNFKSVDLDPGRYPMDVDLPYVMKCDNGSASAAFQQDTTGHSEIKQQNVLTEDVNSTTILAGSVATDDLGEHRDSLNIVATKADNHSSLVTAEMNPANKSALDHPEISTVGAVNDAIMKDDGTCSSEATTVKDPATDFEHGVPQNLKHGLTSSSDLPAFPVTKSASISAYIKENKDNLAGIAAATEFDIILLEITGLQALEKKILELDGRLKPGSRTGSTWRVVRCLRNEQDIGSLFEIRDEYFAANA